MQTASLNAFPRHLLLDRTHATSRIHYLPTEVLQYIFTLAISHSHTLVPTDDTSLLSTTIRSFRHRLPNGIHPFVLSSVCWRWRQTAFSTSSIWSDIIVEFPNRMPDDDKCVLLHEWLERSSRGRSSKMTIVIPSDFASTREPLGSLPFILTDILSEKINCCEVLMICCGPDRQSKPLINRLAQRLGETNSMPSLAELIIPDHSVANRLTNLRGCPMLHSLLTFAPFPTLRFVHREGLSPCTLRYLQLDGQLHEIYTCLLQCPHLVQLRVVVPATPDDIHTVPTFRLLVLPNLKHLSITMDILSSPGPLLDVISTPSLTFLNISMFPDPDEGFGPRPSRAWESFIAYLSRSKSRSLVQLSFCLIDDIRPNVDDILEIFEDLPMLQVLKMDFKTGEPSLTPRFWPAFNAPRPSPDQTQNPQILLPCLRDLAIEDEFYQTSTLEIGRFLIARLTTNSTTTSACQFQSLLVGSCSFASIDDLFDSCPEILPYRPKLDIKVYDSHDWDPAAKVFHFIVRPVDSTSFRV